MSRQEHPTWEDELMPYLDGQLGAAEAARIAGHLETCDDCAGSIADSKRLSRQMSGWKVEGSSEKMKEGVLAELRSRSANTQPQTRWSWWTKRRVWAVGLSGAFAGVMIIVLASTREKTDLSLPVESALTISQPSVVPSAPMQQGREQEELFRLEKQSAVTVAEAQRPSPDLLPGPLIMRSARMNIIAKDFEGARSKLESIVLQSQGYLDQLTVKGEAGSGRVLSATLRLPSDRVDAGLNELRKLGKVREESQNSSDVTSQYVDLGARLTNARNTESRFQTILKERTGKLSDVVDVEREISRIREEIERMEAQQKEMKNQVQFASVQIEMTEEYHAQLLPSVPSSATSLWNASVDGYHTAEESLLGLALLILRFGPTLILWSALLLPTGLVLRRIQRAKTFRP